MTLLNLENLTVKSLTLTGDHDTYQQLCLVLILQKEVKAFLVSVSVASQSG